LSLAHHYDLVGVESSKPIHGSAGPPDFNKVDDVTHAKPKVKARVIAGAKASASTDTVILGEIPCNHFDSRADAVAIAFCTYGFHLQPAACLITSVVAKQRGAVVDVDDGYVQVAVIVVVAEGAAASR